MLNLRAMPAWSGTVPERVYPFARPDIAFGGRRLRNKRVGLCLQITDNKYICGFLQRIGPDLIIQNFGGDKLSSPKGCRHGSSQNFPSPCTALLSPHAGRGFSFARAPLCIQPPRLGLPVAKDRCVRYPVCV